MIFIQEEDRGIGEYLTLKLIGGVAKEALLQAH
jgi:hypothetical protein